MVVNDGSRHVNCQADWGVCPEHGNTLSSSGGETWCRAPGCGRRWDYDRGGLPCDEPAAYEVRDSTGATLVLCAAHAHDAHRNLSGTTLRPLTGD